MPSPKDASGAAVSERTARRRDGWEPDCIFTFCPNKQGLGTWADLTITGARTGAQPVCEQHWQALRFIPTPDTKPDTRE